MIRHPCRIISEPVIAAVPSAAVEHPARHWEVV